MLRIVFMVGLCALGVFGGEVDDCHPLVDYANAQYIIGYGSLMSNKSKLQTDPIAGYSTPVRISGYARKWNVQASRQNYTIATTFLGVQVEPFSKFNAVAFQVFVTSNQPDPVGAYDSRENHYCRHKVNVDSIEFLAASNRLANDSGTPTIENLSQMYEPAEFWMYVRRPDQAIPPDEAHPIKLSYVDKFLGGCLEVKNEFKLDGFASECIKSTSDWGTYWFNDRPLMFNSTTNSLNGNDRIDKQLLHNLEKEQLNFSSSNSTTG